MWNKPSTVNYNRAVVANGSTETLNVALATADLSGTGDCSSTPCDLSYTIKVKGSTPDFITMQDSNTKMLLAVLTSSHIGTHQLKIKYDSVGSGTKPSGHYTAAEFVITCTVTSIINTPAPSTIVATNNVEAGSPYTPYSAFDTTKKHKWTIGNGAYLGLDFRDTVYTMVPDCGVGLGSATGSVETSAGAEGLAELWSNALPKVLRVKGTA